ncbi:MAG: DUF1566 domain-containing protein [Candidatus Nitronauta litoralis]|uniref:DUF1566 domain-containing protein n=1 Tax=Candidatus Nitronauta litoralis TaxID=2705533 RepID=A0A7T0FZ86_9BACT|nr:MAG: DUF1566 domain-containing protein [Candidatus Nitronauta litoralis]
MRSPLTMLFLLMLISIPCTALSADRFTVDGETVTDHKSQLMWQKGDSFHELKKGMTWYDALEYVDRKNNEKFAGHSDWRLPSMKELSELWDKNRPHLSKDGEPIGLPKPFVSGGSYYLWSSDERNLDNVWYFGLGQREDYFNLKELGDLDQGVKMVRDVKK